MKREERSQPPGTRPDGPHYSATVSRATRSPVRCFLSLDEMVLRSNLMAPRPRLILSKLPLYHDNCRAIPASQPLFGYYHPFGRTNSSFRRIRPGAPRERIRLVPLRLYKEERDEEVGDLNGDSGCYSARHPGPGEGERDGDGEHRGG